MPPMPDNGELVVRSEKGPRQRVRVALGSERTVKLGDQYVRIEFLSIEAAIGNEKTVKLDERMQKREEPVLFVRVDGKPLMVPRDDKEFLKGFEILEGISFRFDWPNPKDSGVHRIFRVVDGEGLSPMLVQLDDTGKSQVSELSGGELVPLTSIAGGYGFLALEGRVRSAVEKRVPRDVTDEQFLEQGGGSDDHLLAAWADVEITGKDGRTVRSEMTPFDRPIGFDFDENGRPRYVFRLVKTKMARDWFSVLTVVDHEDNDVKSHWVQVNSPLRYGGYRFFQATAQPDRGDGLGISGISVTKNPGVIGMYIGYAVLTLGTCWMFFVRPVIDRRRRKVRAKERPR
jgi:hypothetical protein